MHFKLSFSTEIQKYTHIPETPKYLSVRFLYRLLITHTFYKFMSSLVFYKYFIAGINSSVKLWNMSGIALCSAFC